MADGVDVLGYLHWSALDNYEWGSYQPTFGLISGDRADLRPDPEAQPGLARQRRSGERARLSAQTGHCRPDATDPVTTHVRARR